MRLFLSAAAVCLLGSILNAEGTPPRTTAPVANDSIIGLALGESAFLAFDVSHDGFFIIDSIAISDQVGASDSLLSSLCFCRFDGVCSCSATFSAGMEPGVVVVSYTALDPESGARSGIGYVTITVGGQITSFDGHLEEMRFLISRALQGDGLIDGGIAESLLAKLAASERAEDAGSNKTASRALDAFSNELEAQAGKGLEGTVAEALDDVAARAKDLLLDQDHRRCPCSGVQITRHSGSGEFQFRHRTNVVREFLYDIVVSNTIETGPPPEGDQVGFSIRYENSITTTLTVADRTVITGELEYTDADGRSREGEFTIDVPGQFSFGVVTRGRGSVAGVCGQDPQQTFRQRVTNLSDAGFEQAVSSWLADQGAAYWEGQGITVELEAGQAIATVTRVDVEDLDLFGAVTGRYAATVECEDGHQDSEQGDIQFAHD